MRRVFLALLCLLALGVLVYDLSLTVGWWKVRQTHARPGFTARQFVDANGEEFGYVLFVPYHIPAGEKPALLLFLNGVGENGTDGVSQISNNFGAAVWETRRAFPMICLAPQCRDNWNVGSPDMIRAITLLEQVMNEYDVDPDRVYVTGVSAGGAGVWNFAATYPGKFAAIVPVSGQCGLSRETLVSAFADHDLAIWNFFNDGDLDRLVENNRTFREQLFAAGLSPIFTEYHQNGHNAWSAGYQTAAMYEWLSRQSRSGNAQWGAGARFRRLLADESGLPDWEARGPGEWSVAEGIVRCGGTTAGGTSHLILSPELADFELHFDYQSASDAACELVLDSVDAPGESLRVVIEWPESGTSGVVHERSGAWLGTSDPIGQRAMISGRWNDIRVSLRNRRLQLHVNGAPLHDALDQRLAGKHRIGLRVSPIEMSDGEWRYLRLRELNPSREDDHGT